MQKEGRRNEKRGKKAKKEDKKEMQRKFMNFSQIF